MEDKFVKMSDVKKAILEHLEGIPEAKKNTLVSKVYRMAHEHIIEHLDFVPSFDVRENVQSSWGNDSLKSYMFVRECQNCGNLAPVGQYCYCCGARNYYCDYKEVEG